MTRASSKFDRSAGAELWRNLLTGSAPDALSDEGKSCLWRFAGVAGARYALHLLGNPQSLLPAQVLAAERTWARYRFAQTERLLLDLTQAGFEFLLLKGQAFARILYPDPSLRLAEDVDLLVRERQLPALLEWLKERNFRLQALPTRPWGFMSESSFWPLMSPDRMIAIDLHLQADAEPFSRGLAADQLFAQALSLPGSGLLLPCREHLLVLLISNAAKVKFGPSAWRRATDLALLLRLSPKLDWLKVAELLRACGLARAGGSFFSLLTALGLPAALLPPAAMLDALPGGNRLLLGRVLASWRLFDERWPSHFERLWRELFLGAGPLLATQRNLRRFVGLFRRPTGVPPGWQGPIVPAP